MGKKTIEQLTADNAALTKSNKDLAAELVELSKINDGLIVDVEKLAETRESLVSENAKLEKRIESLTAENAEHAQNNKDLAAKLKARTDEVGAANTRLEALEKSHEALKAQTEIKDAEKPGTVSIDVKNKKGKVVKAKVTITIPFVRAYGEKTSSVALMKVASGKSLSEAEQKASPILKEMDKDEAIALLTKWAKMGVGYMELS